MGKSFTSKEKKIIGNNIWVRRNLAGMSTKDLAEVYGVTSNAVNVWERGEFVPPHNKIKEVAKILGCSAHDLCRPYEIPKLSFTEVEEVKVKVKFESEPVMSDEDMVKAAAEVFENAYIEPKAEPIPAYTVIEQEKAEPQIEKVEKLSLSERLNGLYETLFATLDELDKLKVDIAKVEQVTAMLKEIQGL